jgi:hypothetical protein
MTEVREMTLSERTFDRWAMTSSVIPSAKNSFSGSVLRLRKGRMATEGGAPAARPPAALGPLARAPRAKARSPADWKRPSRFFSRQCMTIRSSSAGTDTAHSEGGFGVSFRMAARVSALVALRNGRRPTSIS